MPPKSESPNLCLRPADQPVLLGRLPDPHLQLGVQLVPASLAEPEAGVLVSRHADLTHVPALQSGRA